VTDTIPDADQLLAALEVAALAAAAAVPVADPLEVGAAVNSSAELPFDGIAVTARFSGPVSGEVLIAIERAVVDALENSPLGSLDVVAALTPALDAATRTLGPVVLSPAQAIEPATAVDGMLAKPNAGVVALTGAAAVRALVGLAIAAVPEAPNTPKAPSYPTPSEAGVVTQMPSQTPPVNRRMEMLRDVAMDVTAQIGSTRMTVSELLALSDGAVIELDRAAGAPADLLVNGHLIARGEVVVVDENFGLRITEIVSDEATSAPESAAS
jgi:flagellar motor switch protein FliN